MSALHAYIDGIGLLGPGLDSWAEAKAILSGRQPYLSRPLVAPPPAALPPAERRRAGTLVKVALAAASAAIAQADADAARVASVFTSSGADGDNCHALCEALASSDRLISPTRFTNSVHNAAAGYWSIAAKAMTPSSVVCAYDASFGTGLIEAMTMVAVDNLRCLLVAYDSPYPEPLNATRPMPSPFGVALLLSPQASEKSLAGLSVELVDEAASILPDGDLETLRQSIPSARSLPLLAMLARGSAGRAVIDYLAPLHLAVEVSAC